MVFGVELVEIVALRLDVELLVVIIDPDVVLLDVRVVPDVELLVVVLVTEFVQVNPLEPTGDVVELDEVDVVDGNV